MFNKVVLVGNLTRDIELRYTQSGSAIGNTGIAVTRKFNGANGEKREETCFVDISFFGRQAETANQYLNKGSKVLIEGRLKLDQWTDQNGNSRSKHSVSVESMEMLGGGQGGYNNSQNAGNYGNSGNFGGNNFNGGYNGANAGNGYNNSYGNAGNAGNAGNFGGGFNQAPQNYNQNRQVLAQPPRQEPKSEFKEEKFPEIDVDNDEETIPF